MKRWSLFPCSLRQLVLMTLLLLLVWQTWESLSALSERAADTNRTTLTDVRRSEAMARTALELERSYRQYCVLDDPMLARLYQTQRSRYSQMLDAHAPVLPDMRTYQNLRQNLTQLSQIKCLNSSPIKAAGDVLESFSAANGQLVKTTREVVFSRGLQLQREIADRAQYFGWQALILFLLSLGLVLLFTRMIIGLMKVELMINRLGEGCPLGQSLTFKGPREIRSLAQRILWLSERLAWLESQRHEFLRYISHELKTPLASMREGTELLADEVAGPLTTDQLVSTHSLTARAKLIDTAIDLQAGSCRAEPTLLLRAIDNLYSNALHYGAELGKIWIRSRQQGNRVSIEVANTGTSIPQAERVMIFELFFQGNLQRKGGVKGSGLGLSIAKDCVRQLDGDLQLVDSDEADVCFRIELNTTAGRKH
ncbi:sensor histidine kinase [Candidatus Erwinia dacicola]|uniref:histidine kinase n=1 Tax=Candidatus Erwinia dacicola TaxID=252393 RepID=A0A328TWQ2_9GAMM|nr:HAMP domain-containing sensor histidine kinase [Candidatus Erwinia dacicola]NJC99097.1 HAMP domain-containing histidine kinase [Candidatus Erwinia dacicola]RAP72224.1 sensor histidine kinase QseE [Candidatus Erwinia dacicola]